MASIDKQSGRWKLQGEMTMQHILALRQDLLQFPPSSQLEIDFSQVTQVDTATVSMMFELIRKAQSANCKIQLTKLPQNLVSLLTLYGVEALIQ